MFCFELKTTSYNFARKQTFFKNPRLVAKMANMLLNDY